MCEYAEREKRHQELFSESNFFSLFFNITKDNSCLSGLNLQYAREKVFIFSSAVTHGTHKTHIPAYYFSQTNICPRNFGNVTAAEHSNTPKSYGPFSHCALKPTPLERTTRRWAGIIRLSALSATHLSFQKDLQLQRIQFRREHTHDSFATHAISAS
jgi:hypothetical protein